jgi:hypothetical protein
VSAPLSSYVTVEPGSRLEELLATYAVLKPQADELTAQLKAVTDGIKTEMSAAAPGAQKVDVAHPPWRSRCGCPTASAGISTPGA